MSRYIAVDKLKADIKEVADITDGKLTEFEVLGIISAQPTADVVEVVRCKDCKYYETDGGALMVCEVSALNTNDNDFCSFGERAKE